ncbi:MAG: hypothetical protein D3904_03580 [Candidatus Electrothrix sp. EH2]|nr:hypothetical protein [Candidatus Electrothrix sp. EH2]
MLVIAASAAGQQDEVEWLDDPVTIRFQDELMSVVLGKISQQSGVAILYDEKLADQKVTGYYKGIKFSEAINRLFSEKNKSIQVFRNEKKIIVKTFGAKQFVLAGNVPDSTDSEDESEGMTLAELRKMHARQYKEYRERIADDNEVLEGGMTRGEVRKMQEEQYSSFQKRLSGYSGPEEVKKMQNKQYEKFQLRLSDDNFIVEGDMTQAEVRAIQEKQYRNYQKKLLKN